MIDHPKSSPADELFEEEEYGRLVSFSRNLVDTFSGDESTLGVRVERETLPQDFGHFQLIRYLGSGPIGRSYLACQKDSVSETVVKKIHPDLFTGPKAEIFANRLEQFRKESMSAMAVEPDHVSLAYGFGKIDGQHFYCLDHVEGKSLAKRVRANTLSNRNAASLLKTVAMAVHKLHRVGIYHRSLSPDNIVVDVNGQPCVREPGASMLHLEQDDASPFRAPELDSPSQKPTVASEIWSLGAILYNCLVGEPPQRKPVAPRKRYPGIARDLESICLKCLHRRPESRYADVGSLVADVDLFLEYQPVKALPAGWLAKLVRQLAKFT